MNKFRTFGSLMAAVMLTGTALATELETDAQKLGYIIGMDIGSSLKQQGTELDLEALYDAIKATYNGEELAMTPEEAATIRELLRKLVERYPRMQSRVDEGIAVSINGEIYRDNWGEKIPADAEIFLLPRIAGG